MSIQLTSAVNSDTIDTRKLFFNKRVPQQTKTLRVKDHGLWQFNSDKGRRLIKLIVIKDDIEGAQEFLKQSIPDFYVDAWFYVNTHGIKTNKLNLRFNVAKPSKSNVRVQDIKNPNSWVSRETFIKRYNLNGLVKNIPYVNYENNDSGNENCVFNYVKNHYKKVSNKQINERFNKKDVTCNDIYDFCNKYKIQCKLYNITKKLIYSNDYDVGCYPAFNAIIANNHLYPMITKKNSKATMPTNSTEKMDKDSIDFDKDIIIETDTKITTNNGIYLKDEIEQKEIDNAFFTGMIPNWLYKSEKNLMFKSLIFNHPNITKELKYEIDINKAFYTIANDIDGDSRFPIFTCHDMYEKFTGKQINNIYYYLLSKDALETLKDIGIISNSQPGFMVNYLIKRKLIKIKNVEYVKKCTYTGQWSAITNRIEKLAEKNPNIKKEYIFYNGILGRTCDSTSQSILNILKTDEKLFDSREKEDDELEWEIECLANDKKVENDYRSFHRKTYSYRYINMVSVYNNIIAHCNLFMLKVLFSIKKLNKDCELLKIKVDSLGFNKDIVIPEKYEEYFKIVPADKINKKCNRIESQYYDGKVITKRVLKELDCFSDNISLHGPPGTGKTYEVKNKDVYNFATTMTNVCSLNISTEDKPGSTVYSLFNLYSPENMHKHFAKFKNNTVWIDEFSMLQKYIWNYVFVLSKVYNTKFIISGDINQTGPIGEDKIDMESKFVKKLMGEQTLLTDHAKSRNDTDIIKLRNTIMNSSELELHKIFYNLEDKQSYKKYDRHLCFTHKAKDIINHTILKERGYKFEYYEFNGEKYLDTSVGVVLSARITNKKNKILKNDLWKVTKKTSKGYTMDNCLREETHFFENKLMKYFTLGFATTTHSSQGLTIDEDACIHEIQKMIYVDVDILYTAVTRLRSYNKLHFYNEVPSDDINVQDLCKLNFEEDEVEYSKFDEMVYV